MQEAPGSTPGISMPCCASCVPYLALLLAVGSPITGASSKISGVGGLSRDLQSNCILLPPLCPRTIICQNRPRPTHYSLEGPSSRPPYLQIDTGSGDGGDGVRTHALTGGPELPGSTFT
uniref:Secreted protein n=1 Tax=Echinococcus granulosus TaxID=6210 RepID=A0A068WTK3_ECHGR|nr:hypothetical protein EgrG_000530800 [Echinococcus granulosus]